MNRRILAVLGLGMVVAPWALAQMPSQGPATPSVVIPEDQRATKEQIAKLFEVMRLKQQMASMEQMMPSMVQQQIQAQTKELMARTPGGATLTPEQQEQVGKVTKQFMEKAYKMYPMDEMIADASAVYQRHISRDDADAVLVFYNSPVGRRLLDAQPVIMQEYMPIVMGRMQERTKALTDEMAKAMQDLMKSPAPEKN
jgi:hypothetical protein